MSKIYSYKNRKLDNTLRIVLCEYTWNRKPPYSTTKWDIHYEKYHV